MFIIEERVLDKKEKHIKYILNYPIIKLINKENNFINYINNQIYEDILCFKEVVQQILEEEKSNLIINLLTEYTVTYNKNNIISIPIEFNQFIGLYNTSYINSYNYDLNLEKEIKLKDIFDELVDYKALLNNLIKTQLSTKLEECEEEIKEDLINFIYSIEIYNDQPFYLENDGLVVCFSSYEMGNSLRNIIEFKIMYEDVIDYFSDCFISEVML